MTYIVTHIYFFHFQTERIVHELSKVYSIGTCMCIQ